jgi:hypothetical protein
LKANVKPNPNSFWSSTTSIPAGTPGQSSIQQNSIATVALVLMLREIAGKILRLYSDWILTVPLGNAIRAGGLNRAAGISKIILRHQSEKIDQLFLIPRSDPSRQIESQVFLDLIDPEKIWMRFVDDRNNMNAKEA